MKDVSVILPSYKPDEKLLQTVIALENAGFEDIIVVDDGGGEEYKEKFDVLKERESCTVLIHPVNMGKGAALKTAFKWYLENRNGIGVITVDGDGQHKPEDVLACVEKMRETGNIVLGVRNFDDPEVPDRSRRGNNLTRKVFKKFVRMDVTDTQTGLRAIPADKIEGIASVKGNRYEYETNMLLYMKRAKYDFDEVEIKTVYINENETSHFRPVRDSVRIYSLIIKFYFANSSFAKFFGSSMICYLLDTLLFALFGFLMTWWFGSSIYWIQLAIARILSSLLNYSLNRKIFKGGGRSVRETVIKYYLLVLFNFVVGSLVGEGIFRLLKPLLKSTVAREATKTAIKMIVDAFLYLVSYNVQRKYIFAKKESE